MTLGVPLSDRLEQATALRGKLGKEIAVYLIRADDYFNRDYLYGSAEGDYPDNAERFVFFTRAALEVLRKEPVEIVHCHDWQAALAIVFLKTQPAQYPEIAAAKTLLTVHNLAFQGNFREAEWPLLRLDRSYFTPAYLEFYGRINFLKGGLVFADKITTVSPTYAREILSPEQGCGLEGLLQQRGEDLVGILNGVDYNLWNPEIDPYIAERYSAKRLAAKRACRISLQRSVGLPQRPAVPLIGMVSRLTSQKGLDLVEKIFETLMALELQIVVLGAGETRYEEFLIRAAARYQDRVATRIGFDEPLAHRIEAGADMFLMPSLYEPCGLNQMFSLKYGTIPIVRSVGGLKDTVDDYDPEAGTGTGFVFDAYEPEALLDAIKRALDAFQEKRAWTALRRRAMSKDFSWDRSAQAYSQLYEELLHGS
jgi:starch synthase